MALEGAAYVIHGRFRRGEVAAWRLLASVSVGVDQVFDAE